MPGPAARDRHAGPRSAIAAMVVVGLVSSACGGQVEPSRPPASVAVPRAVPSAVPGPGRVPSPAASTPAAAPTSSVWFEDAFDIELGWVAADPRLLEGVVANGVFELRPHPAAAPAYVWAPRDGPIGPALVVEASVTFPDAGRAMAGPAVADLDFGLRLVLLLGPNGEWRIQRDDATALRTLAGGRTANPVPGAAIRVRLELDAAGATAWVDDVRLGRGSVAIDPGRVGLATQAPADGERIVVDDVRVAVPG